MTQFLKENVKTADLMGVGYYYKQDKPEGFAWFQMEFDGELWKVTIEQHKLIVKCFEDTMNHINLNGINLEQFQQATKVRCEDLIKQFQIKCGYPNGKPMSSEFMNVEITGEIMELISLINIQIYFMSQWDTIPNDEYNGMNYVYKNIQFK
jgi:hypothetical protein